MGYLIGLLIGGLIGMLTGFKGTLGYYFIGLTSIGSNSNSENSGNFSSFIYGSLNTLSLSSFSISDSNILQSSSCFSKLSSLTFNPQIPHVFFFCSNNSYSQFKQYWFIMWFSNLHFLHSINSFSYCFGFLGDNLSSFYSKMWWQISHWIAVETFL